MSEGYGPQMDQEEPWGECRRDRLPRGWTFVLGRAEIEAALCAAGARVRSLSLGRPDLPARENVRQVFDVYFYGDAAPGSFSAAVPRPQLLRMRWTALPVEQAAAVAEEVRRVWLPRGCAWAAAAVERGNTWAAQEHRWRLVLNGGSLQVVET